MLYSRITAIVSDIPNICYHNCSIVLATRRYKCVSAFHEKIMLPFSKIHLILWENIFSSSLKNQL